MLVFNFHHVEPEPLKHVDRKHISMTPEGLRNFIRTLRVLGFRFVCMRDIVAATQAGQFPFGTKDVLITLDDGFENNYQYAAPIFEAEKCPATIFVLPGQFSGTNDWDQGILPAEQRDQLMSLAQIQELAQSNFVSIGSHGMYHRLMTHMSPEQLQEQIHGSYQALQQALGNQFVPVFAYPWGEYNDAVLAVMRASQYQLAFTTVTDKFVQETDPLQVPRYSGFFRDRSSIVLFLKLCRHRVLIS